jgi:DNA-directed RNA polymerase specialized sigma subunit
MTVKEFLNQAYLLDQRIKSDTLECEELRIMAETISSPGFEEHFNASRNIDAPYVRTLEKLLELEEKIMTEMSLLLEVKQQIRDVISQVDKNEYQMVLKYRYIHNYSWPRIADMLNVDATTVQRWHNKAIGRIILPPNCINLKIAMVCN